MLSRSGQEHRCSTLSNHPPERQLDFWLGDWDVTWGDGQRGGNHVVRILDGRAIQESFDGNPSVPFRGMSLSVYVEKLGRWRQTWVDSDGDYWAFEGGAEGEKMILATDDIATGQPIVLRMIFHNIQQDGLDWRWEKPVDGGRVWEVRWEIHYRRRQTAG